MLGKTIIGTIRSPPLSLTIAQVADIGFRAKGEVDTTSALFAILSAFGGGNGVISHLGGIRNAVTGDELLKAYVDRSALRSQVGELIGEAVKERGDVLVLMIDELDRCRPTFALRLLEEVKCLFEDDRLIIIYATNCDQLAHMVKKAYGDDVDGQAYLTRFYDCRFGLTKPSRGDYSSQVVERASIEIPHFSPLEIVDVFKLSLRDVNRYLQELEMKRDAINVLPSHDALAAFVKTTLISVLLAIKVSSPQDYNQVLYHQDSKVLYSYVQRSEYISRCLSSTISQSLHRMSNGGEDAAKTKEDSEAVENAFLANALVCMTELDVSSTRFREASTNLNEWGDVDILRKAFTACG